MTNPRLLLVGCCIVAACLAGCAIYPMGLSRAQWESLPPSKQAEYRVEQSRRDEESRARARHAQIERDRLAAEAARREAEHLATRYERARWGDVITVGVSGGTVAFHGKRFPYEPLSFDMVRGETKRVIFSRQGEPQTVTEIEMRLTEDGNTFYFDSPSRKRFVAVRDGSWERGARFAVPEIGGHDGHSEAFGVTLHIRLKEMPGRPRTRRP